MAQLATPNATLAAFDEAVFLAYQNRWIADTSPLKVIEKSRRIGLSWAEAADAVLTAGTQRQAGGMNVLYIGYNRDMARGFVEDCVFWARHFSQALEGGAIEEEMLLAEGREGKDIFVYRIKFASGFTVSALSSRPAELRGKQGLVILDEAAFHDDLPGLLKAAMALLIWGGRVHVISTHNGEDSAFNELIQDIRSGRREGSVHRVTFDDALADGLYERICLKSGDTPTPEGKAAWVARIRKFYGDDTAEELDVIPSAAGGVYLPTVVIEAVMRPEIPVLRLTLPPGFTLEPQHVREADVADWCHAELRPRLTALNPVLHSFFGQDFARTGDLSVILPAQRQPNLDLLPPFVLEMRGVPFEQQRQVLFYIVGRLPRFTAGAMDGRGNGQYLAEVAMQKYGASRIQPVMASPTWYIENMPRMKAAIEDRTVSLPRDAGVLADLKAVRMERGVPKVPDGLKVQGADGRNRHGDVAIALANLIYAARVMNPAPIEYEATGRRASTGAFAGEDGGWAAAGAERDGAGFGGVPGGTDLRGY